MPIHVNSVIALNEEKESLATLRERVFENIRLRGPGTVSEIASRMGFLRRGDIHPRITEMLKAEKVKELHSRACRITGKTAAVIDVNLFR